MRYGKDQGEKEEWRRESELRYGEVQGKRSTEAGCRESDAALSFGRRVESSSDTDRSGGTGARDSCSSENLSTAVIEALGPTTWQKDFNSSWIEYVRPGFPKYVVVHRKGVGNEAEG